MRWRRRAGVCGAVIVLALGRLVAAAAPRAPQGLNANDLYNARQMLREAYETVKKNYYDPQLRGLNWDARFKEYDDKLKSAASINAGNTLVAAFLDGLKDSHTYFAPPSHAYRLDYGYRVSMVGDDAFITRVRPGTDAESKVKPGDRLLALNGGPIGRDSIGTMEYLLNMLSPQPMTRLLLRNPGGEERTVDVTTKVVPTQKYRDLSGTGGDIELNDLIREEEDSSHLVRQQISEHDDVMIWKVPTFVIESGEIDKLFSTARKHTALILDLRGNPGGLISAMARMVGCVFDHDVAIATRVTRKEKTVIVGKTRGAASTFTGKLIVLLDSESASASELFARVIELEHRGTVIGDRSMGAVMEARVWPFAQGDPTSPSLFYAFSITDADLLMKDGKSLERAGVTPDEVMLPTAQDLASGRDPVLAHAAQLLGWNLDPTVAGKLFPFEWKPF
jgi:carboxyl-terminal processing protease